MSSDTTPVGVPFLPQVSGLIRRFGLLYVGNMLLWTVIHGLPLVVGLAVAELLDHAVSHPTDARAWWLLALAVGAMVARALVLFGGLSLDFTMIFKMSARLKERAFTSLVSRSQAHGPALDTGDELNRIRDDSDEIAEFVGWTADFLYRSVLLVVALVVLLRADAVTTVALVPLIGGLWIATALKRRVGALQDETRQRQGRIAGSITDLLTGIRDLRLGGRTTGQVERLSGHFAERRRVQARQQMYADLLTGLFRNIVTFGTAIVLIVISARVVSGDFRVGTLALFITYTSWLGEQIFFFGRALARYQSAKVSHDRLHELVTGDPVPAPPTDAGQPLRELRVAGLAWRPADGSPGTAPVSFTARPGQVVVLTGPVGVGKSSLVKGMLGLRGEVTGSVRWNDREVLGDPAWWRSPRVGHARQGAAFVTGTVRDNLLLGEEDHDGRLARALDSVRLDTGSHELPAGLDTEVGSGTAGRVSGGQRQRLAIARMLCSPAEVYVVDDVDSSLDPETARALWENLPRQWPAVWIVVSHDPHVLARADTVVRIEPAGRPA